MGFGLIVQEAFDEETINEKQIININIDSDLH